MSTFKRLFNVGKGKAKTARRDVSDALDPVDMLDSARHKAADAAEAMAEALRPTTDPGIEPVEHTASAPRSRPAPRESEPQVEEAEEVAEAIERDRGAGPKKRTL